MLRRPRRRCGSWVCRRCLTAKAGRFVVRLKGGDPYVFGRGFEEVLACTNAGIPVTVVPGITSAISVPAAAGIPVTHRAVTHEFVVVSGHLTPDDPTSLVDWPALGRLRGTLILLMALERIATIADTLITHGRPPDTPLAVITNGTLPSQRTVHSTLREVATDITNAGIRPPAIVIIGPVVALGGPEALMRVSGLAIGQTRAKPLAGEHCVALDPESC
jgi:uroporphyrin-III C-methyltransferase/precorrin-2 dehydrogenase/sirohydrochlorin ferrochelatase